MWTCDDLRTFRQLADILPFGVCISDLQGKVHFWNCSAEQITGYLRQEVLGRTGNDEQILEGKENSTASSNPQCCRWTFPPQASNPRGTRRSFIQHKQGHRIPALIRVIPLRDENGIVIGRAELFQEDKPGDEDFSWVEEPAQRLHPWLGIPSAFATEEQLRSLLTTPPVSFAIFLVEFQQLRDLVKKYGAEMERAAQRNVVHTLNRLLPVCHYLGCWAGGRFCVLVPDCNEEAFGRLEYALRAAQQSEVTWWGDRVPLKVRIRGTLVQNEQASVESVMASLGASTNLEDESAGERT